MQSHGTHSVITNDVYHNLSLKKLPMVRIHLNIMVHIYGICYQMKLKRQQIFCPLKV